MQRCPTCQARLRVSVHSPCLYPGSAAILNAISAGETPALPGGSERLRLRQEPFCPRCKTDITILLAIEAEASAWLMQAVAHLAAGDDAQALSAVESSLRLKREPLALLMRGFLNRPAVVLDEGKQPVELNALEPVAVEALPSEGHSTDNLAQASAIDRVLGLAKRFWRNLLD